jgi:hypothetical protein
MRRRRSRRRWVVGGRWRWRKGFKKRVTNVTLR